MGTGSSFQETGRLKRLPVSVFGMLGLARFRISYVIDRGRVHYQPNNQPALAAAPCLAPSASLHWSLAPFEPHVSRNKLKLIITISYRLINAACSFPIILESHIHDQRLQTVSPHFESAFRSHLASFLTLFFLVISLFQDAPDVSSNSLHLFTSLPSYHSLCPSLFDITSSPAYPLATSALPT